MNTFVPVASAVVALFVASACSRPHVCPSPTMTKPELVGAWVGYRDVDAVRLELNADGTARLIHCVGVGGQDELFVADSWELDHNMMFIAFRPVAVAAWPLYLRASCSARCLYSDISLSCNGGGPRQELIREEQLDAYMARMRAASQDARAW